MESLFFNTAEKKDSTVDGGARKEVRDGSPLTRESVYAVSFLFYIICTIDGRYNFPTPSMCHVFTNHTNGHALGITDSVLFSNPHPVPSSPKHRPV